MNRIKNYIFETIGIYIEYKEYEKTTAMPLLINNKYKLYEIDIYNNNYIMAIAEDQSLTPAKIEKHIKIIRNNTKKEVIIGLENCNYIKRKRLIEKKIPFIVPDRQMYLPELLIDLREYFTTERVVKEYLAPSTQMAIIFFLCMGFKDTFTNNELKKMLPYDKMTITRIVNEMEKIGICKTDGKGKNKITKMTYSRMQLWDKTKSILNTPVNKVIYVKKINPELRKNLKLAGISALAEKSMLNKEKIPVFALDNKLYLLNKKNIETTELKEDAEMILQTWKYNPDLLTNNNTVDTFSLYLALRNDNDERVQYEIENLIRNYEWK